MQHTRSWHWHPHPHNIQCTQLQCTLCSKQDCMHVLTQLHCHWLNISMIDQAFDSLPCTLQIGVIIYMHLESFCSNDSTFDLVENCTRIEQRKTVAQKKRKEEEEEKKNKQENLQLFTPRCVSWASHCLKRFRCPPKGEVSTSLLGVQSL